MNTALWIAVALVCVVLPAVSLTRGGKRIPAREALEGYAAAAGLPLTDEVAGPVIDRIRRRERGMVIGGVLAITLGGLAAVLIDGTGTEAGALVFALAGAGTAFGGAWTMATHRPSPLSDTPVVARPRSAQLSDYLTSGERFALAAMPAVLMIGAIAGALLLLRLPSQVRGAAITLGLLGTGLALVSWILALLALRRVLAAPARSGSDLELAWDDAERAIGLRQVANLVVGVGCFAIAFWLILVAHRLTTTGFYREPGATPLTYALSLASLAIFSALIAVAAAGPMRSWLTGERKGYEQRRLWPHGVAVR
ncbi:hypothetical protein SAMN05443377_12334 [Propionibacterium cyclohexanicum]|uniref:Uncharacterized protein n=1 Tax=Propionibacterium cyclohexanicum TaxID=64702 RepID=A0A1H9TJJ8_9ACTN|nr:hypothetical protein [Propionibacterium cyclohexanicum]SER96773.1 hypothetical protein SAMN05443377_12334 [Propionibacterium cyclohexanicum]